MFFPDKPTPWNLLWLLGLVWQVSVAGASLVHTDDVAQAPPVAGAGTTPQRSLAGPPVTGKIASSLQRVVQRMQYDGVTAANVTRRRPEVYSTPLVHVDTLGRMHIALLVTTLDTHVESVLTAQEVVIERADAPTRLVHAWVPFHRLEAVAALPFVRYLRPPSYASRRQP